MEHEKTRHFGGKTENFANQTEQRKEQKHLKAYKKGDKQFAFGKKLNGEAIYHPVIEIWVVGQFENS